LTTSPSRARILLTSILFGFSGELFFIYAFQTKITIVVMKTDRKATISSRLHSLNVWTAKRLNIARSLQVEVLGLRVGLLGRLGLKNAREIEEL